MRGPIAAGLLALSSVAYAQTSQKCNGEICFSLNIPDATASSGTGDIFFQISGPTSNSWIALGQGSQMSGSQIFVMYTDSTGKNVTVSPRLGTGHVMPQYNSDAKIELLAGSGVDGNTMTANVKCSSCNSWGSSGTQSFSSDAGSWIYAYKSGDALASSDTSETISQHDSDGNVNFDYSAAKGGSSANPLVSSSGSSTGSGSGSSGTNCNGGSAQSSGTATTTGSGSASSGPPYGGPGGPGGGNWQSWASAHGYPTSAPSGFPGKRATTDSSDACESGTSSSSGFSSDNALSASKQNQLLMAHGIIASLAFVILMPLGAIIIRLLSFPGLLWLHAAIQIFAYILFIIAFGIGVYMANNLQEMNEYHPIIGIVLFVLIFFQPILGVMHHNAYKKQQRRTFWSYGHLWLGRIIITLGIINGGLGLLLSDNSTGGAIAYGVIAAIVWLAYVVAAVIGERRRARQPANPPKYEEVLPRASEQSAAHGNNVPMEYYGNRHPTTE